MEQWDLAVAWTLGLGGWWGGSEAQKKGKQLKRAMSYAKNAWTRTNTLEPFLRSILLSPVSKFTTIGSVSPPKLY